MFESCNSLAILNLKNFDTTQVNEMNGIFSGCSSLKVLNIESFAYNQPDINTEKMFDNCNQSMIYCINKDNSPEDVINQLSDFPNLYCSETCFQNIDNKIIPCRNSCIDS